MFAGISWAGTPTLVMGFLYDHPGIVTVFIHWCFIAFGAAGATWFMASTIKWAADRAAWTIVEVLRKDREQALKEWSNAVKKQEAAPVHGGDSAQP